MFFITVINKNDLELLDCACVGFFSNLKDAQNVLLDNEGDVWENTYDWAVIEEIKQEGIYPRVEKEYWFEWVDEEAGYREFSKPPNTNHIRNWSIG